jgi:membrane protein YdbS with pleckstrin-like domain
VLRRLLVEWLRVPPEPQPPPGSPETLRVFRAAPAFYYYSVLKWAMKQAGAIFGIFLSLGGFGLTIGRFEGLPIDAPLWIETAAIAIFSFQAVGSFLLIRLNYELRWYMVSDRSLRIREGIFRITEQTMTVANIQNMAVRQGPLQRRKDSRSHRRLAAALSGLRSRRPRRRPRWAVGCTE